MTDDDVKSVGNAAAAAASAAGKFIIFLPAVVPTAADKAAVLSRILTASGAASRCKTTHAAAQHRTAPYIVVNACILNVCKMADDNNATCTQIVLFPAY